MNRNCFKVLLSAGLLLCTLAAGGRTTYTNPVIAHDCPDPTVLDDRARTGYFYVYSTQSVVPGSGSVNKDASAGAGAKTVNLPIYRSRDLVDWEFVCDGFPDGRPAWVEGSKLWAPDINYVDGKYVLYYALGVWAAIFKEGCGVAISDSPTGPFVDKGEVVSWKGTGVANSIDANLFRDSDGRKYLYWGSLGPRSGIWVIPLSDDGFSTAPRREKKHLGAPNMEGAYVVKRGGWYYLFTSKGSCCEHEKSSYRLLISRSRSPMGPFRGPDGKKLRALGYSNVIMGSSPDGTFIGPGHDSQIITDDAGQDWMLFHSYWKGDGYKERCLVLERLFWDKDGWPHFAAGHPSAEAGRPVFNK